MEKQQKEHPPGCPLSAVDRRLQDLHRQWHQAQDAYFDPDGFRVAIQTAIQTARTVTFILQSNKAVIPNFAEWYEKWQTSFAQIPLMRWMVDARNKIEKQGDLEAHSFVKAEIVASYLDEGPKIEVPAALWDAPLRLVKSIPDSAIGRHVKKDGFVRIQRKWIENSLPDYELLDAIAIAFGHLSELVKDAHRHLGLEGPVYIDSQTGEHYDSEAMQGRLPCMIGHGDARSLDVFLADGRPIEVAAIKKSFDQREASKNFQRYNVKPEEVFGERGTVEGMMRGLFATATKMFLVDKYHHTILILVKNCQPVHIARLVPGEHGDKYLIMRKMAQEALKRGADAAILPGEAWVAPADPSHPYRRAADAPERTEYLIASLATKDGPPRQISSRIVRLGDEIQLEEATEQVDGMPYQFSPFYEVWGREIPERWLQATADVVR